MHDWMSNFVERLEAVVICDFVELLQTCFYFKKNYLPTSSVHVRACVRACVCVCV